MNLRNNSIQNHTNTVVGEELQESPKLGLEKLELDELDLVSAGTTTCGRGVSVTIIESVIAMGQSQENQDSVTKKFYAPGGYVHSFSFPA